jgi:hypothetical protein
MTRRQEKPLATGLVVDPAYGGMRQVGFLALRTPVFRGWQARVVVILSVACHDVSTIGNRLK